MSAIDPAALRARLAEPQKMLIDGEWVQPETDALLDVLEPARGTVLTQVHAAGNAEVERAVAASATFSMSAPKRSHSRRASTTARRCARRVATSPAPPTPSDSTQDARGKSSARPFPSTTATSSTRCASPSACARRSLPGTTHS